jgi:hypothetical protein
VAELKAHRSRVDPLQKEDAAAGMTGRGVEGGLRQTRTFEQGIERTTDQVRRVDGFARPVREHQRVAFDREPLGLLAFPVA